MTSDEQYSRTKDKEEIDNAVKKFLKKGGKIKSKKIQKGGKKEKGCTKPLYGVKSMSVISIVPRRQGIKSLTISPKCRLKK